MIAGETKADNFAQVGTGRAGRGGEKFAEGLGGNRVRGGPNFVGQSIRNALLRRLRPTGQSHLLLVSGQCKADRRVTSERVWPSPVLELICDAAALLGCA